VSTDGAGLSDELVVDLVRGEPETEPEPDEPDPDE
jgi:hypothetical protein